MLNHICRNPFGYPSNLRNMAIVLSSALFFSCEDPVGIVVDSPSGTSLNTTYSDTISINRTTIKLDSTVTSGTTLGLIGNYTDPEFGKVAAQTFANVNLYQRQISTTNTALDYYDFDLGKAVYDSMTLTLVPINFNYGKDTLKKVNLLVHLLDKTLANKKYNSSETATFLPTPFLTRAINLKDLKKKNGADSSIVFKLSDDFGKKIFDLSGKITVKKTIDGKEDVFGDNAKLNEIIKGFAISLSSDAEVMYSLSISLCSLTLYYHTIDAVGETVLTNGVARKSYPFDMSTTYFTSYKTDYNGKLFAKALTTVAGIPSSQTNNLSYLQNSLGLATKISIPFLGNKNSGNLAINKVDIEIKPVKSAYGFPTAIGLVEINEKNQIVRNGNLEELVVLDNSSEAAVLDTSKKYTLNVTRYFQDYLNKKTKNTLAIVPYNYFTNSQGTASFLRNTDIKRLILDDKSVKMKIYYSAGKK